MHSRRTVALLLAVTAGGSCYRGEGTLGGACERDADCGDPQTCARSVCSLCGDGIAQAGELCLDDARVVGEVGPGAAPIVQTDIDADGRLDLAWPGTGGLVVVGSADDFASTRILPMDVNAVWTGDVEGDGIIEVLTRDAAGGATLWRPGGTQGLVEVASVDTEPLRGLTRAAIAPELGIVAAQAGALVRVRPDAEPERVDFEGEVGSLTPAVSLDGDAMRDVIAWLPPRTLVPVFVTEDGITPQVPVVLELDVVAVDVVAWNADGLSDVVVLSDNGRVDIWLSDGAGGLLEGPTSVVPPASTGLLVADVTLDQVPDVLAFGGESGLHLAVHRGGDLDDDLLIDEGGPYPWVGEVALGGDRFSDLALYDGASLSVLRRDP